MIVVAAELMRVLAHFVVSQHDFITLVDDAGFYVIRCFRSNGRRTATALPISSGSQRKIRIDANLVMHDAGLLVHEAFVEGARRWLRCLDGALLRRDAVTLPVR